MASFGMTRVLRLVLLIAMLCGAHASAAPEKVDLDKFDAARRTIVLPNGITMAYVEMGRPTGRPVLLVHGYTDNARDWVPLVPYLPAEERLILVDLRGHGQSSKPECCYARIDFAYDLKLLLDALQISRADIVGHSLGSIICQTLAEEWPERVGRVVLISSTGGPRRGGRPRKPKFDWQGEVRKIREPIDPDSPFMVAWWASPTPVDEEFLRRQRQDSARIPVKVWLAILDQDPIGSDLQRTLPRLKAPTLLIWGADDPIIEEEGRQTLREALPAAKVRVFPRLGHNPIWEDPAAVAAEINGFLQPADASR